MTPIMVAVESGHLGAFEALVVGGADPHAADKVDHDACVFTPRSFGAAQY